MASTDERKKFSANEFSAKPVSFLHFSSQRWALFERRRCLWTMKQWGTDKAIFAQYSLPKFVNGVSSFLGNSFAKVIGWKSELQIHSEPDTKACQCSKRRKFSKLFTLYTSLSASMHGGTRGLLRHGMELFSDCNSYLSLRANNISGNVFPPENSTSDSLALVSNFGSENSSRL